MGLCTEVGIRLLERAILNLRAFFWPGMRFESAMYRGLHNRIVVVIPGMHLQQMLDSFGTCLSC